MHTPQQAHPAFDAICDRLDDFEPLPDVPPTPARAPGEESPAGEDGSAPVGEVVERLDEQILAGLVSL